MNFIGKVNGIDLQAAKLSPEAQEAVTAVLPQCREDFRAMMVPNRFQDDVGSIPGLSGDFYCGGRFSSDTRVMDRLRGWSDEVLANPKAWVMDALRDCASADHWYTFEKEW